MWVYNEHSNDISDWCPHSGQPAPPDAGDEDGCPAMCRASRIDEGPDPDPAPGTVTIAWTELVHRTTTVSPDEVFTFLEGWAGRPIPATQRTPAALTGWLNNSTGLASVLDRAAYRREEPNKIEFDEITYLDWNGDELTYQ